MDNEKIIYFELNNWFVGKDYPDAEPFISWMGDDLDLRFRNDVWCKENNLCVIWHLVDMSINFLIAAPESWVKENCPELLTKYTEFVFEPDEDGCVYGRFDTEFPEYSEENLGSNYADIDADYY